MSESSTVSEPSYSSVQLSGPPQAVARLMAALAAAGEVIFDHRSAPDVRGEVACTAKVVTYGDAGDQVVSGPVEAVVQSTLRLDAVRRPGLGREESARRLEENAAAALAAVEGVREVSCRLVAVISSAGAH